MDKHRGLKIGWKEEREEENEKTSDQGLSGWSLAVKCTDVTHNGGLLWDHDILSTQEDNLTALQEGNQKCWNKLKTLKIFNNSSALI